MQFASSLYKGGELFSALDCDYSSSREEGLICPFCKESVFLSKGFIRTRKSKEEKVIASWKHYRIKEESAYCEKRSLSAEGKLQLKQLQKPAQNQRLKLFNRRFWDIFKHQKVIPPHLRKSVIKFVDEETCDRLILHCHQRWHVEQILRAIPLKISQNLDSSALEKLKKHPAFSSLSVTPDHVIESFAHIQFTVLRHKILGEAITWLATSTAKESFAKLIQLSILDCLELFPQPIHSQQVVEMAIMSLILTDWESAIALLESPSKAIGFR
jgi:hypothetical protein